MSEIIIETQNSYYDYIVKVSSGCQFIADKIREGNLPIAISFITDISEGLSWLLEVEKHMKDNMFEIESATVNAKEFFTEINEAMERQDYVLIADLFEYEIKPIFLDAENWSFIKKHE